MTYIQLSNFLLNTIGNSWVGAADTGVHMIFNEQLQQKTVESAFNPITVVLVYSCPSLQLS